MVPIRSHNYIHNNYIHTYTICIAVAKTVFFFRKRNIDYVNRFTIVSYLFDWNVNEMMKCVLTRLLRSLLFLICFYVKMNDFCVAIQKRVGAKKRCMFFVQFLINWSWLEKAIDNKLDWCKFNLNYSILERFNLVNMEKTVSTLNEKKNKSINYGFFLWIGCFYGLLKEKMESICSTFLFHWLWIRERKTDVFFSFRISERKLVLGEFWMILESFW